MLISSDSEQASDYIYRIIPIERFVELFTTQKNTLVNPSLWEDGFENLGLRSTLKYPNGDMIELDTYKRMFGQCWTRERASDAMWRIYSLDKQSVRIRTTIGDLMQSIGVATVNEVMTDYCIGTVEYRSEAEIVGSIKDLFGPKGTITFGSVFNSLLVKRRAFRHENEVRLIYLDWSPQTPRDLIYPYEIDPHDLISQVMVDPRVSYAEYKKIKDRLVRETGYSGEVRRSLLYRLPEPITIEVEQNITSNG